MQLKRIEVPTTSGSAWVDRLTPRQMISVGDKIWSDKRKQLIQDLKDADVDSVDRVKALADLDNTRGMMGQLIHHCVTMHGCLDLIAVAAKSDSAENAEGLPDNFDGSGEDAIKIALDLIGADLEPDDKDADNPKKKAKK